VKSEVQLRGLQLNNFFHGASTYQASRRTDTPIGPDVNKTFMVAVSNHSCGFRQCMIVFLMDKTLRACCRTSVAEIGCPLRRRILRAFGVLRSKEPFGSPHGG
jgi:hypothetical protein